MAKTMTREEIAEHFRVSYLTAYNWTRGFYMKNGKKCTYFTDGRAMPIAETKPNRYTLSVVKSYLKDMFEDSWK